MLARVRVIVVDFSAAAVLNSAVGINVVVYYVAIDAIMLFPFIILSFGFPCYFDLLLFPALLQAVPQC